MVWRRCYLRLRFAQARGGGTNRQLIQPACTGRVTESVWVTGTAITVGWGLTEEDGDIANTVQKAHVELIDSWVQWSMIGNWTRKFICAGLYERRNRYMSGRQWWTTDMRRCWWASAPRGGYSFGYGALAGDPPECTSRCSSMTSMDAKCHGYHSRWLIPGMKF